MDAQQSERYSRQLLLPQIDAQGQQRLAESRALVIGLGGLGSPAAMYLAASGVGRLVLVDYDQVELSNLQRQVLHRTRHIGEAKVEAARETLLEINPDIRIDAVNGQLEGEALRAQVQAADVVLDCSDNLPTRFAVNAACFATGTPLVSGAAIRFEGQLSVYIPERPDSPCYRCLYGDAEGPGDECSRIGVFAPVVGTIGTLQAAEALKVLLNAGEPLCGRVAHLDGLTMEWRTMRLKRNPDCPVCGGRAKPAGA